ncbi:MAG: sigma-70 family RNA polymerase sigma factor [Bacillus subtilis]|nr:sigma-70 family RNA polymerase sigma factor [Bacillus subtilis]
MINIKTFSMAQEDRIMLLEAVEALSEPLKDVIKLSFFEDMNQNEIAKKLNISQMQVSRRLKKQLTNYLPL